RGHAQIKYVLSLDRRLLRLRFGGSDDRRLRQYWSKLEDLIEPQVELQAVRSFAVIDRNHLLPGNRGGIKYPPMRTHHARARKVGCKCGAVVELRVPVQVLPHHNVERFT